MNLDNILQQEKYFSFPRLHLSIRLLDARTSVISIMLLNNQVLITKNTKNVKGEVSLLTLSMLRKLLRDFSSF